MVKLFKEKEAEQFIDDVANLRLKIFREYPYLYDGDSESESMYLRKFMNTKDSVICIVFDDDRVVGAFTGLPLNQEEDNIIRPWRDAEYDINSIYYFSEALLLPEQRGKGHGVELFRVAEEWVKGLGKYSMFTLATVIRDDNHPKKPANYISLENFWQNRGYKKTDGLICTIPWKEVGENEEADKPLLFWYKPV